MKHLPQRQISTMINHETSHMGTDIPHALNEAGWETSAPLISQPSKLLESTHRFIPLWL